jgi:hypothetical protein
MNKIRRWVRKVLTNEEGSKRQELRWEQKKRGKKNVIKNVWIANK